MLNIPTKYTPSPEITGSSCASFSSGFIILPNIITVTTNALKICANAIAVSTNGGKILPNGESVGTNGVEILPNGESVSTNGGKMLPNGEAISTNGDEIFASFPKKIHFFNKNHKYLIP